MFAIREEEDEDETYKFKPTGAALPGMNAGAMKKPNFLDDDDEDEDEFKPQQMQRPPPS